MRTWKSGDGAGGSAGIRTGDQPRTDSGGAKSAASHFQVQLFAARLGSPVRWRLLSGNNRECGRGLAEYPDPETCRIAVKEIQRDVLQFQRKVRRSEPNKWGWELLPGDGGPPVVASAHPFDRVIRCERSVELFVQQLATAGIAECVVYTASRRWGSAAS